VLTIGSLFSGIGGLELGLEWSGLGHTAWQVEQNAYCRSILARHWPDAVRHEDVCKVGSANLLPVDLICGGFPCQDVSSAGKRVGLSGTRSGLWYEFARVIAECRPRFVVIENVRSGAAKWVDAVRGDLERLGYASFPVPLAASDLGAAHERARVFLVGCRADADNQEFSSTAGLLWRAREFAAARAHAPDADGQGELQPRRIEREGGRWPCDADRCWTAEPAVARVVHGLSGRVDRERALGNSVVPQCAEVVGHVILQLINRAKP
jgi:DNA (cytosine-5)-methyltransferase 1